MRRMGRPTKVRDGERPCEPWRATATVRFDLDEGEWYFGGEPRGDNGTGVLVIKRIDLAVSTASDLARGLCKAHKHGMARSKVIVDTAPDDEYSPEETVGGPIAFRLDDDGTLLVELTFTNDTYIDDDASGLETILSPLITPYLRRNHAVARRIEPDLQRSMAPYFHTVRLAVPTRSRTLLDLYTVADNLGP